MKKHYNIGFLLTAEHSCFNAAFGLAHILQERGHNTVFFVYRESVFVQYVDQHGFKPIKIAPIVEPQATKHTIRRRFRLWKRFTEHGPNVLLKQNRLAALIEENSLDLCFLDDVRDDINLSSIVFAKMGVPTILVSYTFASRFLPEYPPIFSSLIPSDKAWSNLGSKFIYTMLWVWTIGTRGRAYSYDCFDYVEDSLRKLIDQIRDISFEPELRQLGMSSAWSEWKRRPQIPELVFGHRALDWPVIASNASRCYFGATDLSRKLADFDWSIVESGKHIVYCSISTARGFEKSRVSASEDATPIVDLSKKKFRMAKRYLEVVLDCFSRREDWQLIVACGPFFEAFRSSAHAPNTHIFERVPQLEVLKKADLAITWGGAGTVRECINFGVPMLVFPAWTDQFGNAARIVAHNIGKRGNILDVTATELIEMVESVLADKTIRASANEMRMQCNSEQEIQGVVDFVRRHTELTL
ncbi:putative Glycosyltransferase family 28 protein [Candidatus Propionivibrio aalborgensis]|uniref:Putative Glycosyltransferase family 28 protein n=1 Tax=Candidatus Propionivibrio aalborgensis TaxID=1860101 RepID=A0A1A8XNS5_9RHOO|nr:nucleotide disphospho-sugar-binding domain-containing protein [Candidatus Propionivibrio aalborgensis]MBK7324607.1 hypothetical protein [Propionivibrio sp.]MBK9029714.1 hypothetical protein [Propionivibrio sp.]SBT06814.1 putative Glycosyltransferase family 28 protein [Candidatus Propionivibrio aalborgensis]